MIGAVGSLNNQWWVIVTQRRRRAPVLQLRALSRLPLYFVDFLLFIRDGNRTELELTWRKHTHCVWWLAITSASAASARRGNIKHCLFSPRLYKIKQICAAEFWNSDGHHDGLAERRTCTQETFRCMHAFGRQTFWTHAANRWAVTFGTARRGLGGLGPRPVPSSLYQM